MKDFICFNCFSSSVFIYSMSLVPIRAHPSLRSRSRSRSSSPGHSSVQTSVIQSTKAFSQHLNGSSVAAPSSSDMQEETDEDVEMNGASQNGSHAVTGETSTYSGVKNDGFLEMGIWDLVSTLP